jgi:hypothetical protein
VYVVSADPLVVAVVPHRFRDVNMYATERWDVENSNLMSAYHRIFDAERSMGLHHLIANARTWSNFFEFTPVIPRTDGIEVVTTAGKKPLPLSDVLEDHTFAFVVVPSAKFAGYQEFVPRSLNGNRVEAK